MECSLPGSATQARQKLARLHSVVPCLTDLQLNISPEFTSALLGAMLNELNAFNMLRSVVLTVHAGICSFMASSG